MGEAQVLALGGFSRQHQPSRQPGLDVQGLDAGGKRGHMGHQQPKLAGNRVQDGRVVQCHGLEQRGWYAPSCTCGLHAVLECGVVATQRLLKAHRMGRAEQTDCQAGVVFIHHQKSHSGTRQKIHHGCDALGP